MENKKHVEMLQFHSDERVSSPIFIATLPFSLQQWQASCVLPFHFVLIASSGTHRISTSPQKRKGCGTQLISDESP